MISLPAGTKLTIQGDSSELRKLFQSSTDHADRKAPPVDRKPASQAVGKERGRIEEVVDAIESRADWKVVETRLITKQLGRILICLQAAADLDDPWLTSRELEQITDELGARIAAANVAKTIRTQAKGLVTQDRAAVTRFKIKTRGVHYLEKILEE